MKGSTEGRVRNALNLMDLRPCLVYKPPDDSRNWKPADFCLWFRRDSTIASAFLEVKLSSGANVWSVRDLRPAQREGIRQAFEVGMDYWIVVWWPNHQKWTISEGRKVLAAIERDPAVPSLHYSWLSSVAGMDCTTRDLPSILRAALLGEVS